MKKTISIIIALIILFIFISINVPNLSQATIKDLENISVGTESYIFSNRGAIPIEGVNNGEYMYYFSDINYQKYSKIEVFKYDIVNDKNINIYETPEGKNEYAMTYCYKDGILYISYIDDYYWGLSSEEGAKYTTTSVLGINLETEEEVFRQEFDVLPVKEDEGNTMLASFAVDNNQNFYFIYNKAHLKSFDKNGKLLQKFEPDLSNVPDDIIYLKGVTPNGKALLFQVFSHMEVAAWRSKYKGIQQLDNGKFVNTDGWEVKSSSGEYYPLLNRFYFLDDEGNYGIDQYGYIQKFNYGAESTDTEITYILGSDIPNRLYNYGDIVYPVVTTQTVGDTKYYYFMGKNNNIYKFTVDKGVANILGYYSTGLDNGTDFNTMQEKTNFISIIGDYLYLIYNDCHVIKIDMKKEPLIELKNITYTDHISSTRTKEDIANKWIEKEAKYDYTKSIFKTNPSYVNPYAEGELQEQVITDTLNRINFSRWLIGVDELTLNSEKMSRNQKGAVLLQSLDELTHYPDQPSDMSDEFYNEAYDACNGANGEYVYSNCGYSSGKNYNGISAVEGFISDISNVTWGSATGHRQSFLSPKTYSTSFGISDNYSTVTMYYDPNTDLTNKEKYYAYPSAGYFPTSQFKTEQAWSIYISPEVTSSDVRISFVYEGKEYKAINAVVEDIDTTISFFMPDELKEALGAKDGRDIPESEIEVKVENFQDENMNTINYSYKVNFFNLEKEVAIINGLKGDINLDGKVSIKDWNMMYEYINETRELSKEQLEIGDVNEDGKVNIKDWNRLYDHINEVNPLW